MGRFSEDELRRYSRQMLLREVGGRGQERLRAATLTLQPGGEEAEWAARYLLREDLAMFIFERDVMGREGRFLGGTGLHRIDWTLRSFEIGYWRRKGFGGHGYVTEAARGLRLWVTPDDAALRVSWGERALAAQGTPVEGGRLYTVEIPAGESAGTLVAVAEKGAARSTLRLPVRAPEVDARIAAARGLVGHAAECRHGVRLRAVAVEAAEVDGRLRTVCRHGLRGNPGEPGKDKGRLEGVKRHGDSLV